jgi:hypothetical protein
MSEIVKDFTANIDLKEPLINDPIKLVEGDNGNVLLLKIVKDGNPVDLTNCLVQIVFAHSGKTVWQDSSSPTGGITIGGDEHNEVTVRLHSDSFAPNGITVAQAKIYSGEAYETLVSSARFSFKAELSLLNAETVESVEQYSILVSLINACNSVLDRDQADWTETDILKVSYIQHKPIVGTDFQDATQNLTAETTLSDTDAVPFYDASASDHRKSTWANIVAKIRALFFSSVTGLAKLDGAGNVSAAVANTDYAAATHASRHASGSADAVSPASIGAEKERLTFADQTVSTSGWSTYTAAAGEETKIFNKGYAYRKSLALSGALSTMTALIIPSTDKNDCGTVVCPNVITYDGGVYIYAKSAPLAAFILLSVNLFKAVG